eukprot:213604-Chlamydomonas_euryale.AAC.2
MAFFVHKVEHVIEVLCCRGHDKPNITRRHCCCMHAQGHSKHGTCTPATYKCIREEHEAEQQCVWVDES